MLRLKLKAASGIVFLLLNVLLGLSSAEPMVVQAAGTVSDCSKFGPGSGTLQDALSVGGVITFACSGSIIIPNSISITANTTLDATSQNVTLRLEWNSSLNITPTINFTLQNLSVTKAPALSVSTYVFSTLSNDRGNVTIINSTFFDNFNNFDGGAIYNNGGTLNIRSSTFNGNRAGLYGTFPCPPPSGPDCFITIDTHGSGGAIYNSGGAVTIGNSTFSANSATGGSGGGAVYSTGGAVTVTNSTFSQNSINHGGTGAALNGNISLANTIVAYNLQNVTDAPGTFTNNCAGTITDLGNDLQFPGTSCGNTIPSLDPNLAPLADNGGPTKTYGLYNSSPAIDAGNNARCNADPINGVDQRGVARPQGSGCDIGSFEGSLPVPTYNSPTLKASFYYSSNDEVTGTIRIGNTFILFFDLTNPNPDIVGNISFIENLPPELKIVNSSASSGCYDAAITALPGSSTITVSNLILTTNPGCRIAIYITSAVPGTFHTTINSISSTQTGTRPINVQADVRVVPDVTVAYSPSSIVLGGTSTMSLTVSNPGTLPLTNFLLQATLAEGLVVASSPNIKNTCGSGTVTVIPDTYQYNVKATGITLAAGQTCTLSFDVMAKSTITDFLLITVNSNETGEGKFYLRNYLTVKLPAATVNKKFSPANIAPGGTTSLIFTLTNPGHKAGYSLYNISFSDNLPSQITVAAVPSIKTDCGNASVTAMAGGNSISVSGVNIVNYYGYDTSESCTVSVEVTSNSVGSWDNTTGVVSSPGAGPGTTSNTATLTVTNGLLVTNASDSATTPAPTGSLRAAVNLANSLPGGAAISYNSALGPVRLAAPLVVVSGVRIQGSSCANPMQLNATFPNALQLTGNTIVQALQISSTVSPALKVTKNGNKLVCVRVSH